MHIVVWEDQLLKLLKPLELAQIRMTDYIIETDKLEAYLFHSLLEIGII